MGILADGELGQEGVETITLFGRSTENWGIPYEVVLITKRQAKQEPPPFTDLARST